MQVTPVNVTTSVFAFLLVAAGVICWAVYWDYRKKQIEHEERRLMIDKGLMPPARLSGGWPGVRQQELQLQYEERRLMIEKGMVPPIPEKKVMTAEDHLRRGTLMFFLGIGLVATYFAVYFVDKEFQGFVGAAGLVVGLLGLGNLVYYVSMKKNRTSKVEG